MIFTIIFLFLTVGVIVFTVVYMKKQRNVKHNIQRIKGKKNLKTLWGIDDVKEDVIVCGNKNIIVMRIGSIDYHLLSEKEQNALEISLIEIAKTIKYPIQFFSTTEFVDTSEIIDSIQNTIDRKDNPKIIQYGKEIINHLSKMMDNRNLFIRKNYLVLSCLGEFEKSRYELMNAYEGLRFNLMNAKIGLDLLDGMELLELLHREFNKNTTTKLQEVLKEGGLELYVKGKARQKEGEENKAESYQERKGFVR